MSLDLKKLRTTDSNLPKSFLFFERLKFNLLNKLASESDFGKVETVTITPAATAGSDAQAVAVKAEKSMGRARVTATRLVALKTYLDEPA